VDRVIWKAMGLRKAGYAVVFVIFLCGLSIGGSDARTAETLVRNGGSQETDERLV
jgi:hypothetical protein